MRLVRLARLTRFSIAAWAVAALIAGLGGCAARRELGSGPTVVASPGSRLVSRRCAGCHALPDPGAMSAGKWLAGLERMKRRMELPAAEWDSLAALAADTTQAAHP